jgi:hypothetical protein
MVGLESRLVQPTSKGTDQNIEESRQFTDPFSESIYLSARRQYIAPYVDKESKIYENFRGDIDGLSSQAVAISKMQKAGDASADSR